MKSLIWLADSLELVKDFPSEARMEAGHELRRVQQVFDPTDWKPMPGIGMGVKEIRVTTASRVCSPLTFSARLVRSISSGRFLAMCVPFHISKHVSETDSESSDFLR